MSQAYKWFDKAAVAGVVGLGLVAIATTAAADTVEKPRAITISASGYVDAAPDMARINVGVVTEAKSAKAALNENSELFQSVLKAIRDLGIQGADIKTAQFRVSPVYARRKSSPRHGAREIDGFRVVNSAMVTVRDLDKTGVVIDKATTAGANRIGAIYFEVSGREHKLDAAREKAMANAIRRAELYAAAAGASLDEVMSINENVRRGGPRLAQMEARSSMASSTPIEPGEQRLGVTVNVTWRLK